MDESENKEMSTNSSVHEACIENLHTNIETISLSPNSSVSDDSTNFRKLEPSSNSFTEFHVKEINDLSKGIKSYHENKVLFTFNKIPDCSLPLPKLEPSKHHTILFVPHNNTDIPPELYPDSFKDVWDEDHVQMPCSSHNKWPETVSIEGSSCRWNVICKSLKRKILSSKDLEEAIMIYNSEFKEEWNFNTLHKFFTDCLSDSERENFFSNILPRMIDITLDLPKICPQPIPLLRKSIDHYITISQKQIGCLLLNAFFCTFPGRFYFPRRSKNKDSNRYPTYPDVNFNRLYLGRTHRQSSTLQKLKCLINYFTRIVTKEPTGSVTFHRQSIEFNKLPDWKDSTKSLRSVSVDSKGFIETEGQGLLQVDFANKLVGGVLRTGCVQEEIRFVTCPELIVSRLFVEMLGLKEALIITGVEQYNLHSGYSDTFKWERDFCDHTPRDAWGRRCTEIVAINATSFNIPLLQYKTEFIKKELNKAYCGFYQDSAPDNLSGIATGNWGCGAFKGDPHLKFLIQWMAASEVNRDLVYFTFRDKIIEKELKEIYSLLVKKKLLVGDTSTMEQNLRDLMAAAALKRREESENRGKVNNSRTPPNSSIFEALAGSTEPPSNQVLRKDTEESCIPSTSRGIDDSGELFPESPVVEQCSSQEKNSQAIIESQSGSSTSGESPVVEEYDTEVDTGPEDNEFAVLLNRIPDCSPPLLPLEPLENHSIMFSPHIRPNVAPRPYPRSYHDKWNENHVRMPCSLESKFPVEDQFGTKQIVSRWDLICGSLRRRILTSQDLEEAIMAYNTQYRGKWNFDGLHTFFDTCLSDTEREYYFETVLPRMVEAALNLPNVCTQPVPLLKKRRDHSVTISQKQISCLLLNAFFCTYPRRNNIFRGSRNVSSEYASYPDINFNRLFSGRRHRMSSTLQKLMCLFNYFRRVTLNEPTGTVTFHRQYLKKLPKWNESEKRIRNAFVRHDGLIEADGLGLLQVDFANRFVGGGVLATGCIQEEIRFVICPELIVSRLFVESLTPNEALIITGVEQYNSYSGYGDTFKWKGDYQDGTVRDAWGRRCTEVVAINATAFNVPSEQYKIFYVETELEKAYCGFYKGYAPAHLSAIATGNWGCGAFKGDPHLKFLIQLMAASEVGRDLLYFTFGNKTLKKDLKKIYGLFQDKNLAVGDIYRILKDYSLTMKLVKNEPSPKLLEYLCFLFSSNEDTDIENSNPTPAITDSDQHAIQRLIEDVEKEGSDVENTQPSNPS